MTSENTRNQTLSVGGLCLGNFFCRADILKTGVNIWRMQPSQPHEQPQRGWKFVSRLGCRELGLGWRSPLGVRCQRLQASCVSNRTPWNMCHIAKNEKLFHKRLHFGASIHPCVASDIVSLPFPVCSRGNQASVRSDNRCTISGQRICLRRDALDCTPVRGVRRFLGEYGQSDCCSEVRPILRRAWRRGAQAGRDSSRRFRRH